MSQITNPGPWVAALLLLGACAEGTGNGTGSFRDDYLVSRQALESGAFDKAARGYGKLMAEAGPHAPRIQLEYAHALLRADAHARAAQQARSLAAGQSGPGRAAALAVLGVAEHELAKIALAAGDPAARSHLKAADEALTEVLSTAPDFDPVGGMAQRQNAIRAALARL